MTIVKVDEEVLARSPFSTALSLGVFLALYLTMPRAPRKTIAHDKKPYAAADDDSSSDKTNGSFWDPDRRQEEPESKTPAKKGKSSNKAAMKKWTNEDKLKVLNRYLDYSNQTKWADIFTGLFPAEERSVSQVAVSSVRVSCSGAHASLTGSMAVRTL